ncbi:hypothetical protein F503_01310 [Ophiostoma piceae UAMH 11346]|uniref:Uncharacterized protein n=1 Tax=Ophiostoma piceae (strain UAMH 11346) TaxID=1262450 RepID=S3BXY2_OPHP1|nr:hypothetical protein F503_01310 [Ophiostoma piceae UAMH 11346]
MMSLAPLKGRGNTSSVAEAILAPSSTSVAVPLTSVEASAPSHTEYAWKQYRVDPLDVPEAADASEADFTLKDVDLDVDLATNQSKPALPIVKLAAGGVRGVPGRKVPRPQKKDMCISIEDGYPANLHYDDVDQFRNIDDGACKPALSMVDNSCSAHMDIATRCASYCAQSYQHYFGEPHDLMGGSMCREGENCELKQETSKSLQISNKVVDRHVKDTTISVTPGANWAYGFKDVSIPLPNLPGSKNKRGAERVAKMSRRAEVAATGPQHTGHKLIDAIIRNMYEQSMAEASGMLFRTTSLPIGYGEDYEEGLNITIYRNSTAETGETTDATDTGESGPFVVMKSWFKNIFGKKPPTEAAVPGAPQQKASISLPIPTISSPTGSLSATFTRHWLKESVHTHYRASQEAEFTSLTHKQVPGDGCGSFSLVPIEIGTCGWQALPRVPKHMQEDVLNWLSSASIDEIDSSDFKRGVWSKDGAHKNSGRYQQQMWEIGPGGCPATYHEFPTCTHSYAKKPDGTAMGRVVFVKKDCDTGLPLANAVQPRPYRESVVFDELFEHHLLKDARLFNPSMGHLPPLTKGADPVDDTADYDEDDE